MMKYEIRRIDSFSDKQLDDVYQKLNLEQKIYVDSKPEFKRRQSLAVRALLAEILRFEILSELSFDNDGRPLKLFDTDYFSLSHSGEYVAVAVSKHPIGMDIQCHKEVNKKLIERVFDTNEAEYVKKNGQAGFFELWTLKEAFIKCFYKSFSEVKKLSFIREGEIYIPWADFICKTEQNYTYSIISSEKQR